MSFDIAIKIQNLSKCYQIYDKPQDRLKQSIFGRVRNILGKSDKVFFREFWALKGVSFEVKKGETVGIIGRNGSGKSTLLQLICGTLNPSGGKIEVSGRVAALLELGSGFNPEFNGRENVYLNAALLGLNKDEIDRRYGDIVAFADIGDFIDQPVKTYSSGMMVRLAFSVIAHVDADILIVDEALAVGDAVFTQKCARFLRTFQKTGTILFVSHDINSVISLCKSAIWLNHGEIQEIGVAEMVTKSYSKYCAQEVYGESVSIESLKSCDSIDSVSEIEVTEDADIQIGFYDNIAHSDGWKTGVAEITNVSLTSDSGEKIFSGGERVSLKIDALVHRDIESPIIGFFIKDRLGQPLFGENTFDHAPVLSITSGSKLQAEFVFTLPLLPNGNYSMTVSIADGTPYVHTQHHWIHEALIIHVQSPKLRYGLVGIPFNSVRLLQQ